jgi:Flp pilus assembly protein CpaB
VAVRRRLILAGLVALAVTSGLRALAPPPEPSVPVTVAASDLPAGHVITQSDMKRVAWRSGTAPSGLVQAALGRSLASPLRRGEPITDARLVGPGLLTGQSADRRAMAVRVTEPTAGMLRSGDRVDLVAGPSLAAELPGEMAKADVIAEAVLILATASGAASRSGSGEAGPAAFGAAGIGAGQGVSGDAGEVLVVAVDRDTATRLAAVSGARSLSVVLRGIG